MKLDWLEPDLRAALEAMTETQRVSLVLAGEARSEPIEGIVGVASVIKNRVTADLGHDGKPDWWGEGFSDVVTRPWQFSCLHPKGGPRNYKRVVQIAKQFASKQPVTDPLIRQCVLVAHGIVGDYLVSNVGAATHYHTVSLTQKPKWAEGHTPVKKIASHYFYAGIK